MTEFEGELSRSIAKVTQQSEGTQRWIDFSVDPRAAEYIGAETAKRVAEYQPDTVVTWMLPDEAILAHIVSRELGITSARAELDLGLITIDQELTPPRRIVLLTTIDDRYRQLNSLNTLLQGKGHVVVAALSVLSTGEPLIESDVPQIELSAR
jgi:hypothetical protein